MKRLLLFLPLLLVLVPVVGAGISFQPSVMDELVVKDWEKGIYNVTYRDQWVCFTPYVVLDGKETTDMSKLSAEHVALPKIDHVVKSLDKEGRYLGVSPKDKSRVDRVEWGYRVSNIPSEKGRVLSECGYKIQTPLRYEIVDEFHEERSLKIVTELFTIDFQDIADKYDAEISKDRVSIKNIEGLKTIDLDPITYSSPTITVTGTGYDFWDLYNASSVNGWDVVFNNEDSDKQYEFRCKIVVGDGSTNTTFRDYDVQVFFNYTLTSNNEYVILVKEDALFELGEYDSEASTGSRRGCQILLLNQINGRWGDLIRCDENGEVNLYDSSFKQIYEYDNNNFGVQSFNGVMYHCVFHGGIVIDGNFTGYDLTSIDAWNMYGAIGDCEKVYGINPENGIIARGQTIRDIVIEDINARALIRRGDADTYLINPIFDWDDLDIRWHFGTGEVYRQYTFNLEVKNGTGYPLENCTVLLVNADDSNSFNVSTDEYGNIIEQIVTKGVYNETGVNELYDYGPFHLSVSHPDYGQADIYNITLQEPADWEITIPKPSGGGPFYLITIPLILLGSVYYIGAKRR